MLIAHPTLDNKLAAHKAILGWPFLSQLLLFKQLKQNEVLTENSGVIRVNFAGLLTDESDRGHHKKGRPDHMHALAAIGLYTAGAPGHSLSTVASE